MFLSLEPEPHGNEAGPAINILDFTGPSDVPRVSQYRLAAHLSSAVILYSLFFWNAKVGCLLTSLMRNTVPVPVLVSHFARGYGIYRYCSSLKIVSPRPPSSYNVLLSFKIVRFVWSGIMVCTGTGNNIKVRYRLGMHRISGLFIISCIQPDTGFQCRISGLIDIRLMFR
jgi:hypothetical protein